MTVVSKGWSLWGRVRLAYREVLHIRKWRALKMMLVSGNTATILIPGTLERIVELGDEIRRRVYEARETAAT